MTAHIDTGRVSSLQALADSKQVDILVAGSFGRKGEKLDLLGSVGLNFMEHS